MVTASLLFGPLAIPEVLEQLLLMKLSRLFLAVGLSVVLVGSTASANEIFKFDQAHSTITFKVRHLLGTAKGKFTKFNGTIAVDREHPEQSSVTATIQAASIDTGIAKRDEHLRTADFFDTGKFPEITFKSSRVKQTGPKTGEVTGEFTMHGVTRTIYPERPVDGRPRISRSKCDDTLARDHAAAQAERIRNWKGRHR